MKCVICHGDQIQATDVDEEIAIDGDIVRVPIRIPVCGTCGERYYDRRTVRYLEEVERRVADSKDLRSVGDVLLYTGSQ